MKTKEAFIRKSAFLEPPPNPIEPPIIIPRLAYIIISEEIVTQALITQTSTKTPSLDKINFRIL